MWRGPLCKHLPPIGLILAHQIAAHSPIHPESVQIEDRGPERVAVERRPPLSNGPKRFGLPSAGPANVDSRYLKLHSQTLYIQSVIDNSAAQGFRPGIKPFNALSGFSIWALAVRFFYDCTGPKFITIFRECTRGRILINRPSIVSRTFLFLNPCSMRMYKGISFIKTSNAFNVLLNLLY